MSTVAKTKTKDAAKVNLAVRVDPTVMANLDQSRGRMSLPDFARMLLDLGYDAYMADPAKAMALPRPKKHTA